MNRKVLLFCLGFLLIFGIVQVVGAQPSTGFVGDNSCDMAEGDSHNPYFILVAYDEEMASYDYWWRDRWIDYTEYMTSQIIRSLSRFPCDYTIAGSEQFKSPDSAGDMDTILLSMETQLKWVQGNVHGKVVNGHWCGIVIGFTNQQGYGYSGGNAHLGYGTSLIRYQVDWADDNTVQEEVSHLLGVQDHCRSDDCTMSNKQKFYYDVWESLYPVEEGGYWVSVWNWQAVGYFSTTWCPTHYAIIHQSSGHPRSLALQESYIENEDSINQPSISPSPRPKADFATLPLPFMFSKDALNPTNPWIPFLILALIAGAILGGLYLYRQLQKRRKEKRQSQE